MTELPQIRLRLDKNRPGPLIPSALETYRALREDGGENGKQIKSVLERLRSEPGKAHAESLRYRPDGRIVLVEMVDESTWWVIWRQPLPGIVDVLWIGPQPGPDPLAYSTETQHP
jgi:hypothetical protein